MASQSVVQGLKAFEGYDQSVFLQWLEGLADMMQAGGDPQLMASNTPTVVGGLMYALLQAADELGRTRT